MGCCHSTFRSWTRSKFWSRVCWKKLFEVPNFFLPGQAARQPRSTSRAEPVAYLRPNLPISCITTSSPCGYIFRVIILDMPLNHAGLTHPALDKPISKLSADHFSVLVKFLELQDIQAARLASRGLHFFLSLYLIKSVRFAAQGDQLAVLTKISQNHVFRRSVRTLRYDVNLHGLPLSTWNELDAAGWVPHISCYSLDVRRVLCVVF
jgi:hypothetical protein